MQWSKQVKSNLRRLNTDIDWTLERRKWEMMVGKAKHVFGFMATGG